MAITTPVRLNSRASGSWMMLSDIRLLLTRPSRCSSTIQAATRTRMLVQKGTSTRIISRLAWRAFSVLSQ